jgi:hypothetical protein
MRAGYASFRGMTTSKRYKIGSALAQRNQKLKLHFCRIDPEIIRDFSDAIAKTSKARLEKLQKQYAKEAKGSTSEIYEAIIGQYFEDEVALTASMEEFAQKLAIVGLYGQLEICIKNMVAIVLPKVNPKVLFRWDGLRDALAKAGVQIEKLKHYKQVNQLRCLNNAIKHSELVGLELAATGWGRARDVIDPGKCNRKLGGFLGCCEEFVKELRAQLAALIPSSPPTVVADSNPGRSTANS